MRKLFNIFLTITWGALAVWGAAGVAERLLGGHADANYGSYIPWGLWISAYIYFIGLSAGAFLLSSMIYVFGVKSLERIARTALFTSAVTLIMALLSVWFDLGHMERFYEVFVRPNFRSMMAWMIWLYTAYLLLILAELWLELRVDLDALARRGGPLSRLYRALALGWRAPDTEEGRAAAAAAGRRSLRSLAAMGIPLAIAFHGGVGALFATLSAKPYWHSALFPVLFLTGALVSGGALMLAIQGARANPKDEGDMNLVAQLGKLVLALVLFDLILEWAEFSIPMWYRVGPEFELYMTVLFGRYWYVFWVFHILLGSLIPVLVLLTCKNRPRLLALAGFLVATTFLSVRLNLVIPGQITPALEGLKTAYVDHRLVFSYVPSTFEWSVLAFVVAVGTAIWTLGQRYLPLAHVTEHASLALGKEDNHAH